MAVEEPEVPNPVLVVSVPPTTQSVFSGIEHDTDP